MLYLLFLTDTIDLLIIKKRGGMNHYLRYFAVIVIIVLSPVTGRPEDSLLILKYPMPQSEKDTRHIYRIKLLELALSRTVKEYGAYRIEYSSEKMSQSRAVAMIKSNSGVDIVALPTSKHREAELHPVRIPILKGLLGYRIFIIRSGDRDKFRNIKNLEDLRRLSAGSGHDWLDSDILAENGLNVVKSSNYEGLFMMLRTKRFDYFPRGINEAFEEVESRQDKFRDIEVEKRLALHYPFPVYFFVRKDNVKLAQRIEKGLKMSIADGSFRKLFDSYNGEYIRKSGIKNRIIIRLKNPLLPEETPLENKKFWLGW